MKKGITFKRIFEEILDLLELKKGLPKTLLLLSYKPKIVIVGYIENFNGVFSGPLRIFYTCTMVFLLYTFSYNSLGDYDGPGQKDNIHYAVANYYDLEMDKNAKYVERYKKSLEASPQKAKIQKVSNFVYDSRLSLNPIYTLPFTLILYSFLTLLLCRNFFTTYLEHLCLNVYATSIILIFEYILYILVLEIYPQWYWASVGENILSAVYCVFVYSRIFVWGNKYLKFLLIPIIAFYNPSVTGPPNSDLHFLTVIGYFAQTCIDNIHLPILDYLYSK